MAGSGQKFSFDPLSRWKNDKKQPKADIALFKQKNCVYNEEKGGESRRVGISSQENYDGIYP